MNRPGKHLAPARLWCSGLLVALLLVVSGCAMWSQDDSWMTTMRNVIAGDTVAVKAKRNPLPPIPLPQDAIQLQIIFIERPIGDPVLGQQLWDEIAPVSTLSARVRETMKLSGFRIGHVASSMPTDLEALLQATSDLPLGQVTQDAERPVGHRIALASGTHCEVQTSEVFEELTLPKSDAPNKDQLTFASANCKFRMKADRLQDGSARLEFTPEIHHGEFKVRPVAMAGSFQTRTTREIVPLFLQKFSIDLAKGETAVVTVAEGSEDSLGSRFFIGNEEATPVQRILLVRLIELSKAEPVYAEYQAR